MLGGVATIVALMAAAQWWSPGLPGAAAQIYLNNVDGGYAPTAFFYTEVTGVDAFIAENGRYRGRLRAEDPSEPPLWRGGHPRVYRWGSAAGTPFREGGMTHSVELETAGGFIRVVTAGIFDEPGYRAMVDDILARPFWQPGTAVLFDHRSLSFQGSTVDLMRRATRYHADNDARIGDGKAAVLVAPRPADFGSARQFESLLMGHAEARLAIFQDLDEAQAWLLAP